MGLPPAAHAVTLFSFVAGAMALFITGYRLSGRRGPPPSSSPGPFLHRLRDQQQHQRHHRRCRLGDRARGGGLADSAGASIAAGFAIKLYPLVLGPLWIMYEGRKRKPIIDFVLGGAGVVLVTFWVILLDGHPVEAASLRQHPRLPGRQGQSVVLVQPVPQLAFLQRPLMAFAIFLSILVAFVPREKTLRRLAALSRGALVIAFQLTVNYWFYAYITWFEPFVFVSLLLATNQKTSLDKRNQTSGLGHRQDGEKDEHEEKAHGR